MDLCELSYDELESIEGGSIWKYIGAIGAIGFGVYEISTGIGAADGAKNVYIGATTVVTGLFTLFS